MPTQHHIVGLVFNDFEALDLFGPLGAIVPRSDYYTLELVHVHNLGAPNGVESSIKNGIGIMPSLSLAEFLKRGRHFHTLFLPGGFGMIPLVWDPFLLQQIGRLVDRASNVFTVCTGSVLLAATGRLNGHKATTNKLLFDEETQKCMSNDFIIQRGRRLYVYVHADLPPQDPNVQWQKHARWVEDGKFVTSSGVTAGIDAGFAFVANTFVAPENRKADEWSSSNTSNGGCTKAISDFDREKALKHARLIASSIEYKWDEDPTNDPFADLPMTADDFRKNCGT
ncbi:MAG: hypothetical protein Q9160_009150 [Pyrenula sp. 1 TL-2023]